MLNLSPTKKNQPAFTAIFNLKTAENMATSITSKEIDDLSTLCQSIGKNSDKIDVFIGAEGSETTKGLREGGTQHGYTINLTSRINGKTKNYILSTSTYITNSLEKPAEILNEALIKVKNLADPTFKKEASKNLVNLKQALRRAKIKMANAEKRHDSAKTEIRELNIKISKAKDKTKIDRNVYIMPK